MTRHKAFVLALLGACTTTESTFDPEVPPTEDDIGGEVATPDELAGIPDGTAGWARVKTPSGVELLPYVAHGGHAIYQDDIDLGPIERVDARLRGGALSAVAERWDDNHVRWAFNPQFDNLAIRDAVRSKIDELAEIVPLEFEEVPYGTATSGGIPWIELKWSPSGVWYGGMSSAIGRMGCGEIHCSSHGECRSDCGQWIYFNSDGENQPSGMTIKHEFLHALGMWHEQSRTDRGSFINFNANCVAANQSQFAIQNNSEDLGPYDYWSIMHYSSTSQCVTNPANNGDPYLQGCSCLPMTKLVDADLDGKLDKIWPSSDLTREDANTMWRAYNVALGTDTAGDAFGRNVAVGDFDGDGYDDVAVGAPTNDTVSPFQTIANTGAVFVFRGTSSRLVPWRTLTQADMGDDLGVNDTFGTALAAGDLDGDGRAELLVGAPNEDSGASQNTGVVHVYRGTRGGPQYDHDITQTAAGGTVEADDRFGSALAIGKFTGLSVPDIAIGAAGDRVTTRTGTARGGGVYIVHEDPTSIWAFKPTRLALSNAVDGDNFGASLAVGFIDAGGNADLVVGSPNTATGGAVHVYAGRTPPEDSWQWSSMVSYRQTLVRTGGLASDRFGESVLVADVSGGTTREVIVGAPGVNSAAGRVYIHNLVTASLQQSSPMALSQTLVQSTDEAGDEFGFALTAFQRNVATVQLELVVGAPGENSDAGMISLYAGGATVTPVSDLLQTAIPNQTSEANDRFGASLGAGQLDGAGDGGTSDDFWVASSRRPDLVIGAPGEASGFGGFNGPAAGAIDTMIGGANGALTGAGVFSQTTEVRE